MTAPSIKSGDDFLKEAAEAGEVQVWMITPDPTRPDYILYYPGVNPGRCPYIPIHKDRVRVETPPLAVVQCYLPGNPIPRPVWIARVHLRINEITHSDLVALLSLVTQLSSAVPTQSGCSCMKGKQYDLAAHSSAQMQDYWCLNVEGGTDPGVHYYLTYQDANNSRAYFFAAGARSVTGPYQCQSLRVRPDVTAVPESLYCNTACPKPGCTKKCVNVLGHTGKHYCVTHGMFSLQGVDLNDSQYVSGDSVRPQVAGRIFVTIDVNCPRCGCFLASFQEYREASDRIYVGAAITCSYTGSCYSRGECGSGRFDWRGTVTSGTVTRID